MNILMMMNKNRNSPRPGPLLIFAALLAVTACQPAPVAGPALDVSPTPAWVESAFASCDLSFAHPPEMNVPPDCLPEGSVRLGGLIEVYSGSENPYWIGCQTQALGDCPVMELIEQITIGGKSATRIEGYIGSLGGRIPQRYRTFVFEQPTGYVIFTLWPLPEAVLVEDPSYVWPLIESDIDRFNQIVASIEFR